MFAKNGLHFEGEGKSEKYGRFLDFALNQWMHGEDISKPVRKWFDFQVVRPSVPRDFIEKLVAKYEKKRDEEFKKPVSESESDSGKTFWLGGEKLSLSGGKTGWFYMGEFYTAEKNAPLTEYRGKGLCVL